jgi:5-methylcytosine-specific restriction protein B
MSSLFTWIPIYKELAAELVNWEQRQTELIHFLEELREQDFVVTPLNDKDLDGTRFLLEEIDPFTFFGVFNRGIKESNRNDILAKMKEFFKIQSPLPDDLEGLPVLNNQRSWFFSYRPKRELDDVNKLWRVFKLAMMDNPIESPDFLQAFDDALEVKGTSIVNLSMGLFWIRPNTFLSLDQTNRAFLDIKIPGQGLLSDFYIEILDKVKSLEKSIPLISHEAWLSKNQEEPSISSSEVDEDINFWLVGAYWDSRDPSDQTQRFLEEGIWENGYDDKYLNEVKEMKPGDKIAIKSSFTQRKNLPFDNRSKTISCMAVKAIGTIVSNWDDGKTVEVEWESDFSEKIWYFYTHRGTVWHLQRSEEYEHPQLVKRLIDFTWFGSSQDYDWFTNYWWKNDSDQSISDEESNDPYSIDDIIAAGVFLEYGELNNFLEKMRDKKAIIIQGPPGVGKTFIAKKLAFALMQEKDNDRIEFIQFHQSYSYDDFIRGYRPAAGEAGTFKIQNGIFFEFCQKAAKDPDREYVFIIDEINRGNLSQIFGEVLMLIERDKRGKDFAVPLVYRNENESRFYIPPNVYLIGLMNLADRSLALVDYALRRRFGFINLEPKYSSSLFVQWLKERAMDPDLVRLICEKMSSLNNIIKDDPLLGENYQIGHSYFCPRGDDFSILDKGWYESIVRTEILPLIKEYWFDNQSKINEASNHLFS